MKEYKPLIYVASPYSHADENIRKHRYDEVTKIVAKLADQNIYTIPPITFNVPISPYIKTHDTSWEFWRDYDKRLIDACDEIWIALLEGWQQSVGVRAECKYAMRELMSIKLIGRKFPTDELLIIDVDYHELLMMFNVNTIEELND